MTKKLTKKEREAYASIGQRGGMATLKKHGKKHMSDIGKLGMKKRWSKPALNK